MHSTTTNRGTIRTEPAPVWPEAPRFCPQRSFPPYRYVPGLNSHPVTHPEGHSYGKVEPVVYRPPENWRDNEAYLFAIDLYHQGYLWEAHEAWESVWKTVERDSIEGYFLRGLIQNSAAQLKAHCGVPRGVRTLSMRVGGFLSKVSEATQAERFMGVDVGDFLDQIRRHYRPMWGTQTPETVVLIGPPPQIGLE